MGAIVRGLNATPVGSRVNGSKRSPVFATGWIKSVLSLGSTSNKSLYRPSRSRSASVAAAPVPEIQELMRSRLGWTSRVERRARGACVVDSIGSISNWNRLASVSIVAGLTLGSRVSTNTPITMKIATQITVLGVPRSPNKGPPLLRGVGGVCGLAFIVELLRFGMGLGIFATATARVHNEVDRSSPGTAALRFELCESTERLVLHSWSKRFDRLSRCFHR